MIVLRLASADLTALAPPCRLHSPRIHNEKVSEYKPSRERLVVEEIHAHRAGVGVYSLSMSSKQLHNLNTA